MGNCILARMDDHGHPFLILVICVFYAEKSASILKKHIIVVMPCTIGAFFGTMHIAK